MKFGEFGEIKESKINELKKRISEINLDLNLVEQIFSSGSGKGGQKINKTQNAVTLKYPPMNLIVKCQKERQRALNRFLALRELVDEIEYRLFPETSKKAVKIRQLRRKKARKRRKFLKKHAENQRGF